MQAFDTAVVRFANALDKRPWDASNNSTGGRGSWTVQGRLA